MLGLLLFAACAARMPVPADMAAPVDTLLSTGRNDLLPGYHIGPFRVERPSGGWNVRQGATGLAPAPARLGFTVVGPDARALTVSCAAAPERAATGGSAALTLLEDSLRCEADGFLLDLRRDPAVRGTLQLAGRSLTVEPLRQTTALGIRQSTGVRLQEAVHSVGAVDLLGSGTVHLGGALDGAERLRIVAAAAAMFAWPPPG